MAKKEETKPALEREYNVPLRRKWVNVPKYKRAKKAVFALRQFIIKHMKPSLDEKGKFQLRIGKYLNEELWKHGMKNPPHHIEVVTKKDDEGKVEVELKGAPVEKEAAKETKKEKLADKVEKEVPEKEEDSKKEEKAELKTIKKEKPKSAEKQISAPKKIEKQITAPMGR